MSFELENTRLDKNITLDELYERAEFAREQLEEFCHFLNADGVLFKELFIEQSEVCIKDRIRAEEKLDHKSNSDPNELHDLVRTKLYTDNLEQLYLIKHYIENLALTNGILTYVKDSLNIIDDREYTKNSYSKPPKARGYRDLKILLLLPDPQIEYFVAEIILSLHAFTYPDQISHKFYHRERELLNEIDEELANSIDSVEETQNRIREKQEEIEYMLQKSSDIYDETIFEYNKRHFSGIQFKTRDEIEKERENQKIINQSVGIDPAIIFSDQRIKE